jgi:tetratricopeptide (TPR) repeat protein
MKKTIVLITFVSLCAALLVTTAAAQMTSTVKGKIKDTEGKPMTDVTVVYQSTESGRKASIKADKKGEYFSMGIQPGNYNILLLKGDQQIYELKNIPVRLGAENVYDIDLLKEKALVQSQISPEEKKRQEAVAKEREKVKGLNQKLSEAKTAQDAGNFDEAIRILTEASQVDSTHDIIFARLGEACLAGKKYPEAADAYRKAIAIANKAEYHNNLAQALLKDKKTDEAIAEYNTAAQVDPTNAGMYFFNLGAVLTNQGKSDEAIAAFDKALAADPAKADAYYWKGVNLLGKATTDKTGKMTAPEGTAEALNKYLELAPEGPYAAATKELLGSIGATVQTSFGTPRKKK